MRISRGAVALVTGLALTATVVTVGVVPSAGAATAASAPTRHIVVPEEDRFLPAGITVHVGDSIQWVNNDSDDHTVVSDDAFTTDGHRGTDLLLVGTDTTGGEPGTVQLRFSKAGTFFYYCRFHAHLDEYHQPVAPGPDGGIQDANGNYGTPMMGVVTVLPAG